MSTNLPKFSREFKALRQVATESLLHPMRQEQLKQNILRKLSEASTGIVPEQLTLAEHRPLTMRYMVATLAGLVFTTGTVMASGGSLPGDTLYPVKRLKEKVEVGLALSAQVRANLEAKHANVRLEELTELEQQPVVTPPGGPATTTPVIESDDSGNTEVERHARVEATTQIEHAIESLTKVRTNLEAKGNVKAAAVVTGTISKLKIRAAERRLKVHIKNDSEGDEDDISPGLTPNSGQQAPQVTPPIRRGEDDRQNDNGERSDSVVTPPATGSVDLNTGLRITPPPELDSEVELEDD